MSSRKIIKAKSGKRKHVDSVAAAARKALLSSDSDSDSDDEEPIFPTKQKPIVAKKKRDTDVGDVGRAKPKSDLRHLKPSFAIGAKVYAAWSAKDVEEGRWHLGTVKSVREEENLSPYGPTRFYTIECDDGDRTDDVEDYLVWSQEDYHLGDDAKKWIGIKNVTDKKFEGWPKLFGWYVAIIEGKERPFSHLSDAMDEYDKHVVQRKGMETKESDLNRPEQWSRLFGGSESKGGRKCGGKGDEETNEQSSPKKGRQSETGKDHQIEKSSVTSHPSSAAKEKQTSSKTRKRDVDLSPNNKRQKIASSDYKGVTYSKQHRKYSAQIESGGKLHSIGFYKLQADAALAYDEASQVLLENVAPSELNFSTRQKYEQAIEMEMQNAGHLVDVEENYKMVTDKVEVYLSNIYAAKTSAVDIDRGDNQEDEDSGSDLDMASESSNNEEEAQNVGIDLGDNNLEGNPNLGSHSKKSKKHSVYVGVMFYKRKKSKKWSAQIRYDKKNYALSCYSLEADAALAHDEAARLLKGPDANTNFATLKDYEDAKKREMDSNGVDLGPVTSITALGIKSKVDDIFSKHQLPKYGTKDAASRTSKESGGTDRSNITKNIESAGKAMLSDEGVIPAPDTAIGNESNKLKKKVTSAYVGVCYHSGCKKWLSQITYNRKTHGLSYYKLEADAALAYDEAAKLFKGPDAKTNFATLKDYEDAKKLELGKDDLDTGISMSAAAIKSKVADIFSNRHLPKYDAEGSASMVTNGRGSNERSNESPALESKSGGKTDHRVEMVVNVASDSQVFDAGMDHESTKLKKKQKFSDYVGVSRAAKKWAANVTINKKNYALGVYLLEANAALAYDEAARRLKGTDAKTNFTTLRAYEDAKKFELENIAFDNGSVMSSTAIKSKVARIISKHYSSKNGNEAVASIESHSQVSDAPLTDGPNQQENKKKYSDYVGVSFHMKGKKWRVQLRYMNKVCSLSTYKLEADAALAYDEAAKLLKGPEAKMNFDTLKAYEDAKKLELAKDGLDIGMAMSAMDIKSKVAEILSKRQLRPKHDTEGSASMVAKERGDNGRSGKPPALGSNTSSRKKHSRYTGVTFNKRTEKYLAQIYFKGKMHFVGYWRLEADAAKAYDEASVLLKGDSSKVNFVSRQAHKDARAKELENSNASVENYAAITTQIGRQLSRIECPEISAINDAFSKKWASFLPSGPTGKEYLTTYQQTVEEMLGFSKAQSCELDASARSAVSAADKGGSTVAPREVMESVQGEGPDVVFKPVKENAPKTASSNTQRESDSDDDGSLFSSTDEIDATPDKEFTENIQPSDTSVQQNHPAATQREEVDALPDKGPIFNPQASAVNEPLPLANNNEFITPAIDEDKGIASSISIQCREFPIGCPVLWNFDGSTFCSGTVTGAPTADGVYNVTGAKGSSDSIAGKDLAFGPNCPIYYVSPNHGHDEQLGGKILFCTSNHSPANVLYTVLIGKEGNQFQVMKDVKNECVIYRNATNKSNALAEDTGDNEDRRMRSQSPEKRPSTLKPAAAEGDDSQTSSQQFFSSNSTITTADSAAVSSRRVIVDDKSGPDGSNSVDCRVYIPNWLVHNDASKQRFQSHLLRNDKQRCLQRIGSKTNCTLKIIGDSHILIQTKKGKYAIDDIRKAAESLESTLLDYINHDGSSGRLFYDIARSCSLLHPKGSARSTSVMQRNPFSSNHEMGWMNILELPREGGNRKLYHGHYILKTGVLGLLKRETKCEIKICGNDFKVPTRFCPPYVWVMGDTPAQVDRAVEILHEATQKHIRQCRCSF